jgi:hypothetical protein
MKYSRPSGSAVDVHLIKMIVSAINKRLAKGSHNVCCSLKLKGSKQDLRAGWQAYLSSS